MKLGFYTRLALSGIRGNRRMYLPYLLTCAGMVTMEYIILSLVCSPALAALPGGETRQILLGFGSAVIAVFMAVFLFYTNSFLMRRRRREFGLYNILGMDKRNIARILLCETLVVAAASLAAGLAAGVLLSTVAEYALARLVSGGASFRFGVPTAALIITAAVFGGVMLLLLVSNLSRIHFANPTELLRSEAAGEKPPKSNRLLGLLGLALLTAAYTLALKLKQPLEALAGFFVAVLLVIAATYLLFIAGSVAVCRILQRRKRYYYNKRHFISVSSMVYRMKRNGAGLASICMKSIFEELGGSYTRQGDYLHPDLKLPETEDREIGVWGQRYGRWLKAQHRVLYYNLLTKGKLNEALADANERGESIFQCTVKALAEKEGITERLKVADPISWVQRINNIRSRAMEITSAEVMCL